MTEETTYLLTRPDTIDDPAAQEAIDRLAAFWDTVNREDVAIVQRVQEGLATTPFPGGPMCYRFEEPVHRFQNMIADRMVGLRRVPAGDARAATQIFDSAQQTLRAAYGSSLAER